MLKADALPLLLLPGTLCDGRVFRPATARLDVPIIDMTMAGARSAPGMARLVLAAAPPRFALCGFSLGAIVALEIIAQAPERVERLALLGCNARLMPADKAAARRASLPVAERDGTRSYIAGAWDASVPASRRDDRAFRAELEAMAEDTPLAAFSEQIDISIERADSLPRLGAITVPTLVACGAEDRVCPPQLSREIAAGIPGARLAIVERAGHYLTLDQPEITARLLAEWLAAPAEAHSTVSKEFT